MRLDRGDVADGRTGLPLGIDIDLGASSHELAFGDRDGVLLFTDGLPEARDGDRRRARRRPLRRGARARAGPPARRRVPPDVVRELRDAATRHVGGRFADDLCILAARARDSAD